jgi:hypothetical protein
MSSVEQCRLVPFAWSVGLSAHCMPIATNAVIGANREGRARLHPSVTYSGASASVLLTPSKACAAAIKFSDLPIQTHAAQQVLEPRVGAQRVETGAQEN